MRIHFINLSCLIGVIGLSPAWAQTLSSTTPSETKGPDLGPGPKIQFERTVFDFGRISSGELIKHDFVFTNIGTATLEILAVRPACGCTTAGEWDKKVEPGKTGVIPLQFNPGNFGGKISKPANVVCNDLSQSNVVLQFTGMVWKPIDINPPTLVFQVTGEEQTNIVKTARIVSNLEEPIELSDLSCTNSAFKAELEVIQPGKEFALHVSAAPPFTTSQMTTPVTLKTSSTKMPTLTANVYLMLVEPVVISPNQITLPSGPLTNQVRSIVTIRNNGNDALQLSDAAVNIPGAEVHVQELQPARLFMVSVNFPAGLDIQPPQKIELAVKSNHSKYPVIRIPVNQSKSGVASSAQNVTVKGQPVPVITAPKNDGGK